MMGRLVLLMLWFAPVLAAVQEPVLVTGRVIDGMTDEPIADVRIETDEDSTNTNANGQFSLAVTTYGVTLRFVAPGYLDTTVSVESTELEVRLFRNTFAETVEVVSEVSPTLERPSATPIASTEIFAVAGAIDNVFRTLDTLPGVAATDDFGSRLSVRGGTPDQNLTVMDGIEVHNPYRLFGIASAFNPETIESFELTAGGFGVQYGDRLSSLLVVNNRVGERQFQGAAAVSVTDGNVVVEGSTPGPGEGTWLLSARRTYYDLVAGRLQDQNFPSFADVQLQAGWEVGRGHRLSFLGLRSREDADLDIDGNRTGERATLGSDARNDLISARFDAVLGARGTSRTIVSSYRNVESLDFDGSFRAEARRSNAPNDDGAFGLSDVAFERAVTVRDISVRQELNLQVAPTHLLSAGAELHRLETGVRLSITGDRNDTAANGSSVQGGAGLPDLLDSSLAGTRGAVWIQDTYVPASDISLEPGLRLDWSTANGRTTLSPRVAASAPLAWGARLRVAAGLFTQSPGYEKLVQSDYFIDLSDARTLGLRHERATHLVLGIERALASAIMLRVEGYYKWFNDSLVGRLETETERLERVAQYDFPDDLKDSVPTAPLITSNPTNDASGLAYGFDAYATHTNAAAPLTGWLSYAWGRAERESYGRRFAFEYDRRHAFNAVGRYRLTDRWDLAATARVASGFPYTSPIGLRVAAVEDDRGRLVPETDQIANLVYTVDYGDIENLNSGRLPIYARVDLRATYQPGGPTGRWSLYIEVINLLGRDNPIELEPRLKHDPDGDLPRLTEVPSQGLPRIPTFGFRIRF